MKFYTRRLLFSVLFFPFLTSAQKGTFPLVTKNVKVSIVYDNKSTKLDSIIAHLLAEDIERVTSFKPTIMTDLTKAKGNIIVVGNIQSALVQKFINKQSLVHKNLSGKWECFTFKTIDKPRTGISKALVIAGSDARGTAYGVFTLSEKIGVSPWYWWADVPVKRQKELILNLPDFISSPPAVKYRGIFINDEDWGLQPWAAKTFEPETGDIGPKTYAKVFELLLRLKANLLWPAMHPSTKAFFHYPGNVKTAEDYQIVIGSSHAEPMLRNNVSEWNEKTMGPFNYVTNEESVYNYWEERVKESRGINAIYTLGMRGVHDSRMEGVNSPKEAVPLLERIIKDQRQLLSKYINKDVTAIPQAFTAYKEVLAIYDNGLKLPDDVTLVWPDDNHGYIRRLSDTKERQRSGGAGVYYHISYWGRPHDFLWIESVPASLIWEEMHKAFETKDRGVWVVNVGDIKANEIGMNFFLNTAWNPNQYSPDNVESWYDQFAEKQFGVKYAAEIGDLLKHYFQLNFSRKPEHMGWNTVYPNTQIQDPALSLYNYGDEVQQRIDAYNSLEKKAESIEAKLPDPLKDAFFELVAYKVIGASNMNKKLLCAYKSREYAKQGRVIANEYADQANLAFEKIKGVTKRYNQQIAGGKWNNIISWQPRELPVFGMPNTGHVDPGQKVAGGVSPEGYSQPLDPNGTIASLPVFNACTKRSYFVDVFNSGSQPLRWKVEANQAWVKLSESAGTTSGQERIWVSVDWNKISSNDTVNARLNIELNGQRYLLSVKAIRPDWRISGKNQFVEDNGVVAIEAEHFSQKSQKDRASWKLIEGLGRKSDAMATFPVIAPPFHANDLSKAPSLAYDFYSASSGLATLHFYCLPNQPINADYQLRFLVSIDGGKPVMVNAALKKEMDENNPEWQTNVLRAAAIPKCVMNVAGKGKHRLKITMIDPGIAIDRIVIDMGGLKASYFGAPETKTDQKFNDLSVD